MSHDQLLKVGQAAEQICGPDVFVKRTIFDAAAFVIQPCDYEQFSRICKELKGSGQHIKPLSAHKGTGCICNIGKY